MAERDKWGRIPATIIEVDQDFCSLTWSEGQCKAGPESNLQIFTRDWPTDDIWTKTGTPTPAFQTPNGFPTYLKPATCLSRKQKTIWVVCLSRSCGGRSKNKRWPNHCRRNK